MSLANLSNAENHVTKNTRFWEKFVVWLHFIVDIIVPMTARIYFPYRFWFNLLRSIFAWVHHSSNSVTVAVPDFRLAYGFKEKKIINYYVLCNIKVGYCNLWVRNLRTCTFRKRQKLTLPEKCPNLESFLVRIQENTDQKWLRISLQFSRHISGIKNIFLSTNIFKISFYF